MKKLMYTLAAFIMLCSAAYGQQSATKPTKKAPVETASKPQEPKAATGAKMKKDGTPDMRYKDNKTGATKDAKPAGPLKKDGTPDMRHKANKDAAKAK